MSTVSQLRQRLSGNGIIVAPGIYDAFGAALAERAGFDAVYLSGASFAHARFGRPDIGLVGMSEVAETVAVIAERIEVPVIVDADTGYGNALNVVRTVERLERDGAAAIQIEDQTIPKRCGHLAGKTLVTAGEMVGKIKAAVDTRRHDVVIIARTDAVAVEGIEPALERAERYAEAGADVLFVEAPRTEDELAAVTGRFKGRFPLLANMVEGGKTPLHDADELEALGFAIVIFPGGLIQSQAKLSVAYFESLRRHGSNEPFRGEMLDFEALNDLIGTADALAAAGRYDGANFEADDN